MRFFFLLVIPAILAIAIAGCQTENADGVHDANPEAECATDADCAAAGCSGQLCAKAEDAAGIITTCEYREEYSCLQLTSCGCAEGKCAWAETEDYKSCLQDYKKKINKTG